jgi:hypothetical protein
MHYQVIIGITQLQLQFQHILNLIHEKHKVVLISFQMISAWMRLDMVQMNSICHENQYKNFRTVLQILSLWISSLNKEHLQYYSGNLD